MSQVYDSKRTTGRSASGSSERSYRGASQTHGRPAANGDGFFRSLGRSIIKRFTFLPIRLKLGLIIGSIVVSVVGIFGVFILQSQKIALMNRMTQVCDLLIRNLAESAKGDLIDDRADKITEHVMRLRKTSIVGLKQAAVLDRKGEIVASFDISGEEINFENSRALLSYRQLNVIEKDNRFDFYYPIMTQFLEGGTPKDIQLGVAYISFSKRAILAPIERARDIALGSGLLVIVLSIIGINLIAKRMAVQIQRLSNAAREVGKGNLNIRIVAESNDELGLLASEFNHMLQHLREKLQMQKFMSKLTVDMIKDTVRTNGKKSRGTRREVAVLFCDVRNFATVAEELDPAETVKLINIYFDLKTKIIEGHHGIVDKFMGDQIMAIFQGKNKADNVLRAAVEIQRQIRLLNQERIANHKVALEVGIGINLGTAVMGHMGSAHRMDYTVIGDAVNVAARLCSYARARQVIASYELARRVNGSYPTSRLRSISVKGRMKAIDICEVDYERDILV